MNGLKTEVVNLLIVDDHAMFREGLVRSLEKHAEFRVAGQCSSAADALAELQHCGATMVLLDVDLGSDRALNFVEEATRMGFGGRILIVTAGISDQEAVNLVKAGVSGILHKHHSTEVLDRTRSLWLRLQQRFGSRLHHRDVVGVVLRRLERDLERDERSVLGDLDRELGRNEFRRFERGRMASCGRLASRLTRASAQPPQADRQSAAAPRRGLTPSTAGCGPCRRTGWRF